MLAVNASRTSANKNIEQRYMTEVFTNTAEMIREMQQETVEEYNLFDTGELKKMLQGHFSTGNTEGGAKLSMRYLSYTRFLDMRDERRTLSTAKREGYHLYNRIVFGILYNQTRPQLIYGFTDDVKQRIYQQLLEAVGGNETRANIIMNQQYG